MFKLKCKLKRINTFQEFALCLGQFGFEDNEYEKLQCTSKLYVDKFSIGQVQVFVKGRDKYTNFLRCVEAFHIKATKIWGK